MKPIQWVLMALVAARSGATTLRADESEEVRVLRFVSLRFNLAPEYRLVCQVNDEVRSPKHTYTIRPVIYGDERPAYLKKLRWELLVVVDPDGTMSDRLVGSWARNYSKQPVDKKSNQAICIAASVISRTGGKVHPLCPFVFSTFHRPGGRWFISFSGYPEVTDGDATVVVSTDLKYAHLSS